MKVNRVATGALIFNWTALLLRGGTLCLGVFSYGIHYLAASWLCPGDLSCREWTWLNRLFHEKRLFSSSVLAYWCGHKISAVTTDSPFVICCSAANRESPFPIGIPERVAKKKRDGPDLHDHKAALCFAANTQLFRIPTFRIVCNHP